MKAKIIATGSSLPKQLVTNHDLAKRIETSDEWITTRTGIKQRYICGAGESTSTLAIDAAQKALKKSGLKAEQLDMIIVATSTPDLSFPGVSAQVQQAIGNHRAMAFDVQAACSGFLYALGTADSFMKAGKVKHALVIGAESFSKLVNWEERSTCVLFGDGAAAAVVSATGFDESGGLLDIDMFGDGQYLDLLKCSGGVATTQTAGTVEMNGREVFKNAVRMMGEAVENILTKNGLTANDVALVIPHQANLRILEALAKRLDIPHEKVMVTVDKHANTSAASIPLALDCAITDKKLKVGDKILFIAFGAGFSWAAGLYEW